MSNNDLSKRKAGLSEAKRALLMKRLRGQAVKQEVGERIELTKHSGPQPLSYTQRRVWFLQQLFPKNRAYNMSEVWRIRGSLDIKALQLALNQVVKRHSSLRTSFVEIEGKPMQIVSDTSEIQIAVNDLRHLPSRERKQEYSALITAEGDYLFDLTHGPLIRLSLIRLSTEDQILSLTLHHIITDEWSNDIFWRDLSAFYQIARGMEAQAPVDPAIQYIDYAAWQRQQIGNGNLDGQLNYWREQLAGELPLLQLPYDYPRPAQQTLRGGLVHLTLPDELLPALKVLGRQSGATLFMTLLAAFQALLYRYGSEQDVFTGTPIANRQRPETKDVMGMFINTVVLRTNFSEHFNFLQLLEQVRQTTFNALANQDLPFDVLVKELHPQRDLSYNPLFQTMFVFNADEVERRLPDTMFDQVATDIGVSKFDLTLFAREANGRLLSTLEYNSDLFEPATAKRMLNHWQVLLEGIIANPQALISTLPLLDASERRLVLDTWNDTAVPFMETRFLPELIARRAAQQPAVEAAVDANERLTYGELEKRANTLAHKLVAQGVKRNSPVGLYSERSAAMIVGILGILKAGSAYVPLEPTYPMERIAYVLEDARAPVVVTQAHLVDSLPPTNAVVVVLDSDSLETETEKRFHEANLSSDDLAYIIYTSGSTGTPKGVMVTHGNLLASTIAREATYEDPVARYLLLSSFAFDSSVAGIFWTLASGGTLVLPAADEEKDVQKLANLVAGERVTHTLTLPSLYNLLLDYARPGSLDSLQVVIVAGEACPSELGRKHNTLLPTCELYNEYGPTEATVWCSVYRLPKENNSYNRPVPIGRPVANYQLYILDNQQQPLPIGLPGELYIGGAGVTAGYWQNPELTAERFLTIDLKGQTSSVRVYRTGDLARWRSDGEVEFLGRADNQVKIRGYRIEPGEIENVLKKHPDIQDVAVLAVSDDLHDIGSQNFVPSSADLLEALLELDPDTANRLLNEVEGHLS